jgi:hypothetical protein
MDQLQKLKTVAFDQQLEDTLRRVRNDFESSGQIDAEFECVAEGESFHFAMNWPDRDSTKVTAAYAALRDSFRRRGVNRYVFVSECWVSKGPGRPSDDPDRGECVQVIAVERNGPRRHTFAEITCSGKTAALGPWEVMSDTPNGWLLELLEEDHSDQAPKAEPPPVGRMSASDFQRWVDQHPEKVAEEEAEFWDALEVQVQLEDLIADQVTKVGNGGPITVFMALDGVLRTIVKDTDSLKGIGVFVRFLKDHPDKFPIFPTITYQVPSMQDIRRCKTILRDFMRGKREVGHTLSAIFRAFMDVYMHAGSQAIGALDLAMHVGLWDPEHQAKLRQVGLRSSFELDDEEGHAFIALSADHYPLGVMGRRNAAGELFVSEVRMLSQVDFAAAVEDMKQFGAALILGSEAKELFYKMDRVTGIAQRTDKKQI